MPSVRAPRGWKWAALTDFARLESGHTPSRRHPEYWGGDTPWIGIKDAKQNHGGIIQDTLETTNEIGIANSSARVLPAKTVCLSRTASVGYVVVMGRAMATSQDFVNWVCSPELDCHFLKYLFLAEAKNLLRFSSGAVHQTIYFPEVKAFHICLPPLPEQRYIVAILDEAFAGLESMRANAEKNLKNARELFDGYLNATFSRKREGWFDTTVGDQITLQRGFDITKGQQKDGRVPVVSSGGIKSFHDTAIVKAPGVVIGRKGTLGKVFYIDEDFWPHDTTLWVKDFKCNNPMFVYFFFLALDVVHLDTGTANPALNRNLVHPIKIVWPPLPRQKLLAKDFEILYSETQGLQSIYRQKLAAIAELKQSILQKAFSGELTAQPERALRAAVA
jgi:type I restriction enzyme S subunit